jgi:hypothetical protein
VKKSDGPCGGRDCSGGCQCYPEKGGRVSEPLSAVKVPQSPIKSVAYCVKKFHTNVFNITQTWTSLCYFPFLSFTVRSTDTVIPRIHRFQDPPWIESEGSQILYGKCYSVCTKLTHNFPCTSSHLQNTFILNTM